MPFRGLQNYTVGPNAEDHSLFSSIAVFGADPDDGHLWQWTPTNELIVPPEIPALVPLMENNRISIHPDETDAGVNHIWQPTYDNAHLHHQMVLETAVVKINRSKLILHRDATQTKNRYLRGRYTIQERKGEGSFGVISRADDDLTQTSRAAKYLDLDQNAQKKNRMEAVQHELDVLKQLDHPHLIKIYESLQGPTYIYLMMNFCNGGNVDEYLTEFNNKGRGFAEIFVARIMKQILQAVVYLHRRNIVHKDIKLENIMLDESRTNAKLIDFGLSEQLSSPKDATRKVDGTTRYVPPEGFQRNNFLMLNSDIWAIGIVIYILLAGCHPYYESAFDTEKRYSEMVANGAPIPQRDSYTKRSSEVHSLFKQMTIRDPRCRPSAEQCLTHPWFKIVADDTVIVNQEKQLVNNMMNFSKKGHLYAAFSNIVVHELDIDNNDIIVRLFKKIDTDGGGEITSEELDNYLIKIHGWAKQDVDRFLRIADVDNDGYLEISELLSACRVWNAKRDAGAIVAAFCNLDKHNKGTIGIKEVADVAILGTEDDIKKLLKEVGCDRSCRISKEAFVDYMLS